MRREDLLDERVRVEDLVAHRSSLAHRGVVPRSFAIAKRTWKAIELANTRRSC
jgi:hypothetical protein